MHEIRVFNVRISYDERFQLAKDRLLRLSIDHSGPFYSQLLYLKCAHNIKSDEWLADVQFNAV